MIARNFVNSNAQPDVGRAAVRLASGKRGIGFLLAIALIADIFAGFGPVAIAQVNGAGKRAYFGWSTLSEQTLHVSFSSCQRKLNFESTLKRRRLDVSRKCGSESFTDGCSSLFPSEVVTQYFLRPRSPANLVRGRSLHVIDNKNFDRAFGRYQLQPQLFL